MNTQCSGCSWASFCVIFVRGSWYLKVCFPYLHTSSQHRSCLRFLRTLESMQFLMNCLVHGIAGAIQIHQIIRILVVGSMPVYNPDTIKMIGDRCLRVWPAHWFPVIIYTLPCKACSKALAKIPCSAGTRASDVKTIEKTRKTKKNQRGRLREGQNHRENQKKPKKPKILGRSAST